jgi:hypothetical protein
VSNAKVARGIGSGCDEEAVRVVSAMPIWVPGTQKGKPVRVKFNLPIRFKLNIPAPETIESLSKKELKAIEKSKKKLEKQKKKDEKAKK